MNTVALIITTLGFIMTVGSWIYNFLHPIPFYDLPWVGVLIMYIGAVVWIISLIIR